MGRLPITLVERAADAAVTEAEAVIESAGATPGRIYVTVDAENVPDGELDATSTGNHVFEDGMDLLAFLCARAQSMARSLGIPLEMSLEGVPIPGPGERS